MLYSKKCRYLWKSDIIQKPSFFHLTNQDIVFYINWSKLVSPYKVQEWLLEKKLKRKKKKFSNFNLANFKIFDTLVYY